MAKNVTIAIDEQLARAARIEAAKAGKSLSRYIAELLREQLSAGRGHWGAADRNPEAEALQAFLSGPPLHIAIDGRMPTAEERNARGKTE